LLPKDEFSAILYDEVIDTKFAEKASLETGDYVRRLRYIGTLMQIAAKESARILDFGAGFGMSSRIIGLAGLEVIAYDSSITRQAHQVASSVKSCCNWSEVTKAGPYTAVICDNVLEHVADLHQTLRQLTTVMEQGAILYVSVPSYEQSVIARLQKEYTGGVLSDPSLNPWEHLNYFDLYHLDSLLNGHGFNVVKTNELPGIVNVGLRPDPAIFARCKNGLASIKRIFGYIVRGTVLDSVNSRFYRFLEK
jgi:SAM-dependent methyltransferase